jgi:YgiT-type zinc finger domain-containing protein
MKCLVCKNGETSEAKTTVTLERQGMTFVFKEVPALVCQNCGEEYLSDDISKRLLELAGRVAQTGMEISVHRFSEAG